MSQIEIRPNPFWKSYAVHDDKQIKGFFGPYRFLSNFEPAAIDFLGLRYASSENAYQAAKIQPEHRVALTACSPSESKRIWKTLPRIDATAADWDGRKYDIMKDILFRKFDNNRGLLNQLLATGDRYLEETNHWGDTYWGVDIKQGGENNLGKLLMKLRSIWQL